MSGSSEGPGPSKVKAALQALRKLHVAFRGPFVTPEKKRIFIVDDCILTEAEIVTLHEAGKFTAENVAKLLGELKQPQAVSQPGSAERRRSQRVMLRVPVLVKTQMPVGKKVQTQVFTVVVNAHGGLLESPFGTAAGQGLTLINPQTGAEIPCTVVQSQRSADGSSFATAFAFPEPSPRFWPIAFPPLDWGLTQP